ncbi:MAG TPA: hypothetical protein VN915_14455 [Elusimicrobiota bacterium]|nr:hypothetical protein [Elusimicrobiota bacterium]
MEARVWRLIAHHEDSDLAIRRCKENSKIAIGWGKIGDLLKHSADVASIGESIRDTYPTLSNSANGAPSLFRFAHHLRKGDLIIISDGSRRREVAEVTGAYEWNQGWSPVQDGDYWHHRGARFWAKAPADELWRMSGGAIAEGENIRWPLARLAHPAPSEYVERHRTVST